MNCVSYPVFFHTDYGQYIKEACANINMRIICWHIKKPATWNDPADCVTIDFISDLVLCMQKGD